MRFTWFNLMPWPHLPDDFREKNRSVWVDIPNTLYDPAEIAATPLSYVLSTRRIPRSSRPTRKAATTSSPQRHPESRASAGRASNHRSCPTWWIG